MIDEIVIGQVVMFAFLITTTNDSFKHHHHHSIQLRPMTHRISSAEESFSMLNPALIPKQFYMIHLIFCKIRNCSIAGSTPFL
jgi:hypothetical protein